MLRHSFEAMGTEVEALLDSDQSPKAVLGLVWVEREFERLESLLTRFRPDSELSRLNEAGAIDAGPELLAVTRLALEARERTGGRFDPTVHDALVAAGYDRSFELVTDCHLQGGRAQSSAPGLAQELATDCYLRREDAGVRGNVRIEGRRIELDEGVRLDLGGIAKGYAVDGVVAELSQLGPCLVNAGGDLAVFGLPAAGTWAVEIETQDGGLTLGLDRGALATSGSDRRRWSIGGEVRHHLIDPTTGRPAASDLLRVTVTASSAVEAEVLAKSLYLAGEARAIAEADELGIPAVLVTLDGRVRRAGGLA